MADDADRRPWWRDFFDAGYRHLWSPVTGVERTDDEVAGLTAMLAGWSAGRRLVVADVCGGDGRLARPIADTTDHCVIVVDGSRSMLEHGRRQPDGDAVAAWLEADARALPLADGTADVVLCMFTSLGLGADDRDHMAMLASMARALRPGGRLVLEMTHRDFAVALAERRTWFELDDATIVVRSFDFDPWSGRSDERLRVVRPGQEALEALDDDDRDRRWSVRLFTPTELVRMLRAVGLRCSGVYGSLHGEPFEPHEPRMIVVAERDDVSGRQATPAARGEAPMGREPMNLDRLVERLRCPVTHQPLRWLGPERLEALAAAHPTVTLEAALVCEDGRLAYPVHGGIPALMADEAIALDDDEAHQEDTEHEPT